MEYIMISVKICVAELVVKKYVLPHIDGPAQDRHNSNANALEPHPSRTNPSIWDIGVHKNGIAHHEYLLTYRFQVSQGNGMI